MTPTSTPCWTTWLVLTPSGPRKGDSEGGGIGEAEARRVRSALREEFTRAGRGGLLVSEYPGTLQVLGWKPGDVVELERARIIKTDIANAFGVPNAMLDLNEANLASAKSAEYQYARRTIQPRCNRLGGACGDCCACTTRAAGFCWRLIRPWLTTRSLPWNKTGWRHRSARSPVTRCVRRWTWSRFLGRNAARAKHDAGGCGPDSRQPQAVTVLLRQPR